MGIRRNRAYSPILKITERGILLVTRKWVIATGNYAKVYCNG